MSLPCHYALGVLRPVSHMPSISYQYDANALLQCYPYAIAMCRSVIAREAKVRSLCPRCSAARHPYAINILSICCQCAIAMLSVCHCYASVCVSLAKRKYGHYALGVLVSYSGWHTAERDDETTRQQRDNNDDNIFWPWFTPPTHPHMENISRSGNPAHSDIKMSSK